MPVKLAPEWFDEPYTAYDLNDPDSRQELEDWFASEHPGKWVMLPKFGAICGWVDYEGAPIRPRRNWIERRNKIWSGLLLNCNRELLTIGESGTLGQIWHPNPTKIDLYNPDLPYIL